MNPVTTAMKFAATVVAVSAFAFAPAHADDSDIFGSNIVPNVLIVLDSSGSMDDYIASNPYDSGTGYPGGYSANTVYKRSWRGGWSVYRSSVASVSRSSARAALNSDGYWSGWIGWSRVTLRTGNYLNYSNCSSCSALEKKIDIAKRTITNIVTNTEGVNFGLAKFRSYGGQLLADVGSDAATITTLVNGVVPSGYTPLGDSIYDAGVYFKSAAGPIDLECEPNFILLISDGLENRTTKLLVDEATNRFTQDHSTLPGLQNVIVHTVGFAISASEADAANDILETAADNGGGSFYSTNNAAQLEAALQDAIRQIVSGTFSFASPLIPTTSTTGTTKAFLAAFQSDPFSPNWRGYMRAYQRGADGLVPTDANGVPLQSALLWEAGDLLSQRAPNSRSIYTTVNGQRVPFALGTTSLTDAMLGVNGGGERESVIKFVRGTDSIDKDRDGNTAEDRDWKLGDIFHSSPVLLSPPPGLSQDPGYLAFKAARANRPSVVIAGANDGMLHAFRESDGHELWGWIPAEVLPTLQVMLDETAEHGFYVDASPIAADIKTTQGWKTILVFGLRRGGGTIEAIDVSDTANPQPMWTFKDARMSESWSEPVLGKIKVDGGGERYVAFFGGGYDTAQNNRNGDVFFVVDLETGLPIWEYDSTLGAGDRRYMNFSLAANPTAVDLDGDNFVDTVYIGDVGGQVWKFDTSKPAKFAAGKVINWEGRRLFASDPNQANPPAIGEYYPANAIYGAPAIAYDTYGALWVAFGTGDRNHPLNTSVNKFVAFKDDGVSTPGSTITKSALTNVTSSNSSPTGGWYFTLSSNEKVFGGPEIFNEVIFFSSFTPLNTSPCDTEGGTAQLYAVELGSGFAGISMNSGERLDSTDSSKQRSKIVGGGIPSSPIITLQESGATIISNVVVGTTSGELPSNPAPPTVAKRVLYWREVF